MVSSTTIYVQFSGCGEHIRKWAREPFDGGTEYKMVTRNWVCVVDGPGDTDPTCVIDTGDFHDCLYAKPGMCREDCKYWQALPTQGATS